MLKAGDLDRRITFQAPTQTKTSAGHPVTKWFDVDTVWAQVRDVPPSRNEQISDGIALATRPCRIRIRWRDDISANMRVLLEDGRTLHLISEPAELGRKEGLELMAEERSTKGQDL